MPEESRGKRGAWFAPAGMGVAISLVTVFLALLGHGYALAVESMFGVSESLFADSPLDYLRLSSHVVGHWVSAIPESLASLAIYGRLYGDYWPVGLAFTVLWGVVVFVWWFAGVRQRLRSAAAAVVCAVRGSAIWRASRWLVNHWKWALFSLAGIWAWPPLTLWVLAAVLVTGSVLVSVVPLMGFATGLQSLQRWVVEPAVCVAPQSRAQRLAVAASQKADRTERVRGVACVQIRSPEKNKGEMPQGRLVVATAKWAVLFDPVSGAVRRISVEGADIVPVASLDAPTVKTMAPPAAPSQPPTIAPGPVVGTAGSP